MSRKKWVYIGFVICAITLLTFCNEQQQQQDEQEFSSVYLNLHDTVKYVGKEVCRSCHADIYNTFIHTGMGMSFDHATREKSAAIFEKHFAVYDSISNFYYHPFWRNDSLFILEYRVSDGDTIHKRVEHISYIIGSGMHTNSHILDINGYIFQAPITFYTQRKQWDLAPGFEGGFNSRFSRIIRMECMSCHNAISELAPGAENKFTQVPQGINCERCHGPGELHVKEKLAGKRVDTSKYIDYTIVNPANLSMELQSDLCQRCHLQGVAVLQEGKQFLDFKPGMKLSDIMNVFLPQYKDKGKFIMASHAERLQLSQCTQHAELTCITCHDPHVSVQIDQKKQFNNVCTNCHTNTAADDFHSDVVEKNEGLNCIQCHMPKSGSIDIPHVSITDHYIHIPGDTALPQLTAANEQQGDFIMLKCMTCDHSDPFLMAQGYLRFYEGFSPNAMFLDSAAYYLQRSDVSKEKEFKPLIHLYYLQNNFRQVIELSANQNIKKIGDANTLFRIGDAYLNSGNLAKAKLYLSKAVDIMPLNLEFLNKLGSALVLSGELQKGKDIFEKIIRENPKYVAALSNLGVIYINLGQGTEGVELLQKAIALDPDYELAYFNLADYYYKRLQKEKTEQILKQLLRHQPNNQQAKAMLAKVK